MKLLLRNGVSVFWAVMFSDGVDVSGVLGVG